MLTNSTFLYLHPEPFGDNLDPPVRVQLVSDKTQVTGSVGDPGDH